MSALLCMQPVTADRYPAPPAAHQSLLTHTAGGGGGGGGASIVSHQRPPPAAHHQPRVVPQPAAATSSTSVIAGGRGGGGGGGVVSQILLERLQKQRTGPPSSRPTAVIIESRTVHAGSRAAGAVTVRSRLVTVPPPPTHSSASNNPAYLTTGDTGHNNVRVLSDRPVALATRSVPLLSPPAAATAKKSAVSCWPADQGRVATQQNGLVDPSTKLLASSVGGQSTFDALTTGSQPSRLLVTELGSAGQPVAVRGQQVAYSEDLNAFCEGKDKATAYRYRTSYEGRIFVIIGVIFVIFGVKMHKVPTFKGLNCSTGIQGWGSVSFYDVVWYGSLSILIFKTQLQKNYKIEFFIQLS